MLLQSLKEIASHLYLELSEDIRLACFIWIPEVSFGLDFWSECIGINPSLVSGEYKDYTFTGQILVFTFEMYKNNHLQESYNYHVKIHKVMVDEKEEFGGKKGKWVPNKQK